MIALIGSVPPLNKLLYLWVVSCRDTAVLLQPCGKREEESQFLEKEHGVGSSMYSTNTIQI